MKLKHILQGRFLVHPLHPLLVHIPIGLWFASLVSDIVSMASGTPANGNLFAQFSFYSIALGIIVAVPTAITGLAEFVDLPRTPVRKIGLTHMILNVVAVVGYLIEFIVRDRSQNAVTGGQLIGNIILIGVLSVSGYLGGKMVFEYNVGTRSPVNPQVEVDSTGMRKGA